jgi:hypothetical protein
MVSVPAGRGRWRLTLHERIFAPGRRPEDTMIVELTDAYSRRLEQTLNGAAELTFTMYGRAPQTAHVAELQTDVVLSRWSEAAGADVPYFRGIVTQSEDTVSEQEHVVTFTAHDYFALQGRRLFPAVPITFGNPDTGVGAGQDTVAAWIASISDWLQNAAGTAHLTPGSILPTTVVFANPDGTRREQDANVPLRVRQYAASTVPGTAFDELAHVIGGFDYCVMPVGRMHTSLRSGIAAGYDGLVIFYPAQGVAKAEPILEYGSTVSSLTRTVNSADYGNYWRAIGNNPDTTPNAPQFWAEAYNADGNDVTRVPIGLWQSVDNAADVSLLPTLQQQASGDLAVAGLLEPSYTLALRPNVYAEGLVNMGDTLPLVVNSGRLRVNTNVRVVGLAFAISDDGAEDVEVTVSRPAPSLEAILTATRRDVNALARR